MTVEIYDDDIWQQFIKSPDADEYLSDDGEYIPDDYVDSLLSDILGEEEDDNDDWRQQEYNDYRSSELDYLHYL